ncbi:type II toxin-antitoxin system RelE/ParE family toxin [Lacunimicrobium album]
MDETSSRKPLVWLEGEVKTPPFSAKARYEAGMLLRLLQEGESLSMPQAEPVPRIGQRCGALRIRDESHNWRIMYRIDSDAVIVVEVYDKKTRQIPEQVIKNCQKRLEHYDWIVETSRRSKSKGKGNG